MSAFKEIVAVIGTPHLLFLFGIVFIFLFRLPISDLIRRVRTINRGGLTAGLEPDVQREESNPKAVQELLEVVGNNIVISDQENRIRADLDARALNYNSDAARVLIRHLAGTQLLLSFEQIHGSIFGSQIKLLKKLNEVAGRGRPESFVRDFIDEVKSTYTDFLGDWTYETYLRFLLDRALIILEGGNLHITNLGVEYLTWMVRIGRDENRAL